MIYEAILYWDTKRNEKENSTNTDLHMNGG